MILILTWLIGDAHSAAADIKKHLPGRTPGAEGELRGAGAKIDGVVSLSLSSYTMFQSLTHIIGRRGRSHCWCHQEQCPGRRQGRKGRGHESRGQVR